MRCAERLLCGVQRISGAAFCNGKLLHPMPVVPVAVENPPFHDRMSQTTPVEMIVGFPDWARGHVLEEAATGVLGRGRW